MGRILFIQAACRPHIDKRNLGRSAAVALGTYSGGELWVERRNGPQMCVLTPEEGSATAKYPVGEPVLGQIYDIKNTCALFDGNQPHATMPAEGARISLVYFVVSSFEKAPAVVQSQFFDCGFDS